MSTEMKVPMFVIKQALDIPLVDCCASSIEEAKKKVDFAPGGSEEQQSAFLKWEKLAEEYVEKEEDKEKLEKVLPLIPKGGLAEFFAYKKIIKLSNELNDLKNLYHIVNFEPLKSLILQKISNFY
jgi:hypothetical protein